MPKTYEQLQNDIDDGNNPRIDEVWNAHSIVLNEEQTIGFKKFMREE